LAKNAFDKIRGTEESKGNFKFMNLENYRLQTGVGEMLGAALLLVPMTSVIGLVLISTFMGGAVVAHLSLMGGNKKEFPIAVWFGALVGYLLRAYC
jgi:lipid-A-disaccharide synthase-like uncharacterized protein